jgi:hypothetical protein
MSFDTNIIEKSINEIISDEFHRYKSWSNCFQAFSALQQNENHALHLAFYLASWGMYRGSSGLLQKNHLVHNKAVEILFKPEYKNLKCTQNYDLERDKIENILALKSELIDYYSHINFKRGQQEERPISATDTLISKIILGTLGCTPAFDRYFIDGLKETGFKHSQFNGASLNELFGFINENITAIAQCQKDIFDKTKEHYPTMKIIDMYFWQIGYEKELKNNSLDGNIIQRSKL